jgi:hypothetical protein
MRRTILLSLFVLFALSAARDACAQRHGGAGHGFARGGYRFSRGRAVSPYGFGNAYLPSDYGYDSGAAYAYAPQPAVFIQPPPIFIQPPARPAAEPEHPMVTEYKWPAATADSSPQSESQVFAIVLKDGSTLSALTVFSSDDGLHYVDPDERHLRISMSEIDRAATIKLNRARNLNLYLPAPQ